eukprot:scaffold38176_cov290-Amphora_coffeaeformis.AAC.1
MGYVPNRMIFVCLSCKNELTLLRCVGGLSRRGTIYNLLRVPKHMFRTSASGSAWNKPMIALVQDPNGSRYASSAKERTHTQAFKN